jgi:hypothetical protein
MLELIAKHDGRWGWYNLECTLSILALNDFKVMSHVKALDEDGLIRIEPIPGRQPRYWITDAGKAALEADGPDEPGSR